MGNFDNITFYKLIPRNGFVPDLHAVRPIGMYQFIPSNSLTLTSDDYQRYIKTGNRSYDLKYEKEAIVKSNSVKSKSWRLNALTTLAEDLKYPKTPKFTKTGEGKDKIKHIVRIVLRVKVEVRKGKKLEHVCGIYPDFKRTRYTPFKKIDSTAALIEARKQVNEMIENAAEDKHFKNAFLGLSGGHCTFVLKAIVLYDDNTYDVETCLPIDFWKKYLDT